MYIQGGMEGSVNSFERIPVISVGSESGSDAICTQKKDGYWNASVF